VNRRQKNSLEKILNDLVEFQGMLLDEDGRVFEGDEDAEGYVGEAIGALSLALERHAP
jgi:hypothetical protein